MYKIATFQKCAKYEKYGTVSSHPYKQLIEDILHFLSNTFEYRQEKDLIII